MDAWLARLAGLDSGDVLTWDLWRNYKINGGEKKMRDKKKRGLANCEPTSPQRRLETKRQLDSKIAEIKSQESLLLFLFVENCPKILTEPTIQVVWDFLEFLKSQGYYIISKREVFCVPFSHLVAKADLK